MRILAVTSTRDTSPSPCIGDQLTELERLGVQVDRLDIAAGSGMAYLGAAARVLRDAVVSRRRYDVLHGFYGHCGAIARAQLGTPVVVTFQGSDLLGGMPGERLYRQDGAIGRVVARVADGVIVMSEQMKRASGRSDAVVQPFGVNTSLFRPRAKGEARKALGLPATGKLVLFPWLPGRPEKNFQVAERAVQVLSSEGEDVRLVSVVAKPREEVAAYMNACDALVLVSAHEGSPMAVREALACGLPIVSVDVGDVAQVIEGLSSCSLVERSPEAVAEGLQNAFRAGRSEDGAVRLAQLDVTWAANQVFQLYQNLSRETPCSRRTPTVHEP